MVAIPAIRVRAQLLAARLPGLINTATRFVWPALSEDADVELSGNLPPWLQPRARGVALTVVSTPGARATEIANSLRLP